MITATLLVSVSGAPAGAYMQHSLRYSQPSCTSCHYSPAGGGPRTIDGKLFGTHGYRPNSFAVQEFVSADFRLLYYRAKEAVRTKGGMGVMAGAVAGHVYLDAGRRLLLLLDHNFAGFAAAPYREAYLQWRPRVGRWIDTVTAGRFRAPFGIVTDEHRTYARIQTGSEFFNYDTGALVSGNPIQWLHYDWAVVSGVHSTGSTLGTDQSSQWGTLVNARWLRRPWMFGASAAYYDPAAGQLERRAWTLYAGAVWNRWLVMAERAEARGFNSGLARGFVASNAFADAVSGAESTGWLGWLEYSVSDRLALIYKYDLLTPDRSFPADLYERHGLGARWALGPNVLLQVRAERARATPPSEATGVSLGNQHAFFSVLQVAL